MNLVVEAVNNLFRYLNDLRNFVDEDGRVNLLRQLQSYGAAHQLFADIIALNFSTAGHNRVSFAFSAFDKLGNLKQNLGHTMQNDGEQAKAMASMSMCRCLQGILESTFGIRYPDLVDMLSIMTARCYEEFHNHLGAQLAEGSNTEQERLNTFWRQRNMRHGPFLSGEKFERLFLESHGTAPAEVATMPFLVTLGFLLSPKSFLEFRPEISA